MPKLVNVLYLFESAIPRFVSPDTLGFGELTVLAKVPGVDQIFAIGRDGPTYYQIKTNKSLRIKNIHLYKVNGTKMKLAYWLSPIWLTVVGAKFIRKNKVSVIHAESCYLSGMAAFILGKLYKIPTIIEYHATYDALIKVKLTYISLGLKRCLWKLISGWFNRQATAVCANCQLLARSIQENGYPRKVYFYNPAVVVKRYPRQTKQMTFSFIGRLYPDKGGIYLLQALAKIKPILEQHQVRILIAGVGPEMIKMQELTRIEAIKGITFLGTVDKWRVLNETDFLINTTMVQAALEMSIVEALALGIPTIGFGVGDYPETVVDGVTGYKVKPGDVEALALKLKQVVQGGKRKRMNEAAKKRFKERYAMDIQVKRVKRMYQEILDG